MIEILKLNFNTSNVMVLHVLERVIIRKKYLFQYIQCYGSSEKGQIRINGTLLFQYIQCYGSSVTGEGDKANYLKFQYIQCYGSSAI